MRPDARELCEQLKIDPDVLRLREQRDFDRLENRELEGKPMSFMPGDNNDIFGEDDIYYKKGEPGYR